MAQPARARDHTPESIRLEVRSGARAEAAYLRSIGAAALKAVPVEQALRERPVLTVVPRRTRALRLTTVLFSLTFVALLSLAGFQVIVAQQQIELDRANRTAEVARSRFDALRQHNAALRNPSRVAATAKQYGLVPLSRGSELVVSPLQLAEVMAQAGSAEQPATGTGLLARHQQLKRILAESRGAVTP